MARPPKCPTCGTPLPEKPDPALPNERGKRPDATREILRRLTVLEQRVAEQSDVAALIDERRDGGTMEP
jgi:hypothetical protein